MKSFDVWIQGYRGYSCISRHKFLGSFKAFSFYEACEKAIESNKMVDEWLNSKDGIITHFGQKLFDNEAEAAKEYYIKQFN